MSNETMTTDKATARPWSMEEDIASAFDLDRNCVLNAGWVGIGPTVGGDDDDATSVAEYVGFVSAQEAPRICRAVNCHDELLAALEGLYGVCPTGHLHDERGVWASARAAIAKAKPYGVVMFGNKVVAGDGAVPTLDER